MPITNYILRQKYKKSSANGKTFYKIKKLTFTIIQTIKLYSIKNIKFECNFIIVSLPSKYHTNIQDFAHTTQYLYPAI